MRRDARPAVRAAPCLPQPLCEGGSLQCRRRNVLKDAGSHLLFNSFAFIFVFLPIALVGFLALARISHRLAAGWLTAASLVFYGWWDPDYIALLLA